MECSEGWNQCGKVEHLYDDHTVSAVENLGFQHLIESSKTTAAHLHKQGIKFLFKQLENVAVVSFIADIQSLNGCLVSLLSLTAH